MKYITSRFTPKTWQDKTFCEASLMDENGMVTDSVSDWTGTITGDNQEVNGIIEKNAKGYPTFKPAQKVAQGNFATQKKEESMMRVMDRKEEAIEHAGSIKYATELVVAMVDARVWPNMSEEMIKNKVREFISFYKTLYENPGSVAPF